MSTKKYITILNDIEGTVYNMSTDQLEVLYKETEDTLEALLGELNKRKTAELHGDIDNLDSYLKNADTSFKSLKNFIAKAIGEIKG